MKIYTKKVLMYIPKGQHLLTTVFIRHIKIR